MNKIIFLVAALSAQAAIGAEPQQPFADEAKAKLLDALHRFQEIQTTRKAALNKAGALALSSVSRDPKAAMDLLEKCYRQKEYTEQGKTNKQWREWKELHKETLNSSLNRRALVFHIRWALLTLQAGLEPEGFDRTSYGHKALAQINEMLKEPELMLNAPYPSGRAVLSGPIGKVYRLETCKPPQWPDDITNIRDVVRKLVLTPAKEKGDFTALRNGWDNLIRMEGIMLDVYKKRDQHTEAPVGRITWPVKQTPRVIPFSNRTMPWFREVDCFTCGQERTAANRMIDLIKAEPDLKTSRNYIRMITELLKGTEESFSIPPHTNSIVLRDSREPRPKTQSPARKSTHPDALTQKDVQQLAETVELLTKELDDRKNARIRAAIDVLTPAASDGLAAMNLYEKCFKQKAFIESGATEKQWREWKEKHGNEFKSSANRRLLVYHVRWTLVTLQAGLESDETYDPARYAPQALALLAEIARETEKPSSSNHLFEGSFTTKPIELVYDLESVKPDGWPDDIMDYKAVMEALVLAPARKQKDYAALRSGWNRLAAMEKIKYDYKEKIERDKPAHGVVFNYWGDEIATLQQRSIPYAPRSMAWLREVDCYNCGDEKNATASMLEIIKAESNRQTRENYIRMMNDLLNGNENWMFDRWGGINMRPQHVRRIDAP